MGKSNSIHALTLGVLLTCFVMTVFLMSVQVTEGATYYTATNGNDSSPGTQTLPFRTITMGVSVLSPGDILYIRGGTYPESFYDNIPGGTSWSTPVTVAGFPGETVVLKPDDVYHVIHIGGINERYIILDNLVIDGGKSDGIKIFNTSDHIRVKNSEIRNSKGPGVMVIGSPAGTALGCCNEFINLNVHHNGTNYFNNAFYIQSANNIIERCKIYSNTATGIAFSSQNASLTENNIARYNEIFDNIDPQSPHKVPAIVTAEAINSLIHSNIIFNNSGGGIYLFGSNVEINSRVLNNTIYNNPLFGVKIEAGNLQAKIINNILFQSSAGGVPIINAGINATISNNLTVDPGFVAPTSKNFKLQPTSRAINAGLSLPETSIDFGNVPRPQDCCYDIGAHEYKSNTDTTAPAAPTNVRVM